MYQTVRTCKVKTQERDAGFPEGRVGRVGSGRNGRDSYWVIYLKLGKTF
jgi:hypothetical protein